MKNTTNKIPKIIHYCWFGRNPLPELAQKCIASWKEYCPDYKIIKWNEDNFDINYCPYVREAYEEKKWAFVSDVVRLYALVTLGGIYMDTDVEIIDSLNELLQYEAVSGFESETKIPTGLMASQKGQKLFVELLNDYENVHFIRSDGSLDLTTNVTRITNACKKYGLMLNNTKQTIKGVTFLPKEYLCPKNLKTGETEITENTICIHHFDGSWLSEEEKFFQSVAQKLSFISGGSYIAKFVGAIKYRGWNAALKETIGWFKRRW